VHSNLMSRPHNRAYKQFLRGLSFVSQAKTKKNTDFEKKQSENAKFAGSD
jgi:hypothetical protein